MWRPDVRHGDRNQAWRPQGSPLLYTEASKERRIVVATLAVAMLHTIAMLHTVAMLHASDLRKAPLDPLLPSNYTERRN